MPVSAPAPTELQLLLPRALLDPARTDLPCGDAEGLLPVRLRLQQGLIQAIEPLQSGSRALPLAITPPLDAHVHLDKAFSWGAFPNPDGTMAGAIR